MGNGNKHCVNNKIPYASTDLEKMANERLKEYAFKHKEEKGKEEETFRTEIRRQRDKILYTGGFRRLQDKTQVMSATLTGDHRTRLTHTLEVEQIALSVSESLRLNSDLVSAIALGHDVGHTPFGHAAERMLNTLLKDNGGFHHPIQSAKYLWEKYGDKLIDEIYEGILLHDSDMYVKNSVDVKQQLMYCAYSGNAKDNCIPTKYFHDQANILKYFQNVPSTLEAQVVVWADKIAYITHDLEDFLNSSIYSSAVKCDENKDNILISLLNNILSTSNSNIKLIESIKEFRLRDLLRIVTTNLIESSANNLLNMGESFTQADVLPKTFERLDHAKEDKKKRYLNSLIINFDDDFREHYYDLRDFLDQEYILSPEVQRSDAKAQKVIKSLFDEFNANYKLTPLDFRKKIDEESKKIIVQFFDLDELLKDSFSDVSTEKLEDKLKSTMKKYQQYEKVKADIIARIVASYISTMSDTYAENIFCNLNASNDNFIL